MAVLRQSRHPGPTAIAFVMVAQQVAGKAVRDSFFLQTHAVTDLPRVMMGASGLGLLVVIATSWVLTGLSPRLATPLLFAVHGGVYAFASWLAGVRPEAAATLNYLHTGAFAGTVISAFWSLMNERFDPHAAKRAFGVIGTGAAAGGVAGGLLVWRGARVAGLPTLLLVLAAVNAACAVGLLFLARGVPAAPQPPRVSGERPLRASLAAGLGLNGYLVHLAAMVVLVTLADTLLEFSFKAEASHRFGASGQLLPFFSIFYTGTGIVAFALQARLSTTLLARLGLSGTAALLPATTLVTGAIALVVPGFWTTLAARAGSMTTEHSLFRSAYELAYTPLSAKRKRPLKAFIDVGLNRLASGLGGALALLLVASLAADQVATAVMVLVLLAATGSLYLSRALKEGYRSSLEESLRTGAVALEAKEVVDADTRYSFGGSRTLDRREIVAALEKLAAQRRDRDETRPGPPAAPEDPWAGARAALRSRSPEEIRPALRKLGVLPRELVADVIPLLALDPVASDVQALLRASADRHTGALVDALLDPETAPVLRRRLPRVLHVASSQRAVDGLTGALGDPLFEVRFWAAAALLRLHLRRPEIRVDAAAILAVVRRDLAATTTSHPQQLADSASFDGESPFLEGPAPGRREWSLTYFFALLALVFEAEPLRLAFAALGSPDVRLRGTGLEYLDVVLPPDLREQLRPLLDVGGAVKRAARPRKVVLDELLASREALALSPEELRGLGRRGDRS
jgi:TLC ATP/ADP transporter